MNFGMVADDLYRSGSPNELNFPFLEKLQLKKIIFLAPDDPSQQLYVLNLHIVNILLIVELALISWMIKRLS